MTDFADVALEYEKIKDKKEVLDEIRIKDNTDKGKSADDFKKRQAALPDKETHYKLQENLSDMFDTTKRAGARSSLHGLILPGGQKNFSNFHDNYTGKGRIAKKEPINPFAKTNAPKVNTRRDIAMLFELCMDCMERVDKNNCHPNFTIVPPFEKLSTPEVQRWKDLNLKPGMWICYLFCTKCPDNAVKNLRSIKNDPIKNSVLIPGIDGKPISLADKESQEYMHKRSKRISEQVYQALKRERENPESQAFYGAARLTNG